VTSLWWCVQEVCDVSMVVYTGGALRLYGGVYRRCVTSLWWCIQEVRDVSMVVYTGGA